jgi:hypothetical protein
MSLAALKWARAIDLDRSAKAVLVDLAFRANDASECWPGHKRIAETLNVSKDTIERAIKRLRTTGLVTVRQRYDTRGKRTSNCYKLNVGATPDGLRSEKAKTVRVLGRNVRSTKPHHAGDRITDQSLEIPIVSKEEAFKKSFNRSAETDKSTCSTRQQMSSPVIGRLPFTEAVLKKIASLGVDLEGLIERYITKTRNSAIRDPSAYLLSMGQEEAAKALGITIDTVKRLNSSSALVRAAAIGSAMEGPFFDPSKVFIETLTKRLLARGLNAEEVIARWRAKKPRGCTTTAGAERSLEAFVTNEIFYRRDGAWIERSRC